MERKKGYHADMMIDVHGRGKVRLDEYAKQDPAFIVARLCSLSDACAALESKLAALEAMVAEVNEALDVEEINPSNYDHDLVCEMNAGVISAWLALDGDLPEHPDTARVRPLHLAKGISTGGKLFYKTAVCGAHRFAKTYTVCLDRKRVTCKKCLRVMGKEKG